MQNLFSRFRRPRSETLTLMVRGGQLRLLMAREHEVLWYRVVPLNPSFLEGGVISQPKAAAAVIQSALVLAKANGVRHCVAALPGFHALSAVINLPSVPEARPQLVFPREARRLFSYRPESSVLSWWPVRAYRGETSRYIVIVTRRAALQAMREVCDLAGLKLRGIESGPLALARAINVPEGVAIQAESDGCDVVILKSGTIGMVQSAFWGGDIVDPETLQARVIDLVERSIAAHNEANPSGPLGAGAPIFLAGAAAEVLGDGVAEALGRSSEELEPPLNLPEDLPADELMVNLGMVLR